MYHTHTHTHTTKQKSPCCIAAHVARDGHAHTYSTLKSIIYLHRNTCTFRYDMRTHTHTHSNTLRYTALKVHTNTPSVCELNGFLMLGSDPPPPRSGNICVYVYGCVCVCVVPAFIDIEIRWGQMEGGVNGAGSPFVCLQACTSVRLPNCLNLRTSVTEAGVVYIHEYMCIYLQTLNRLLHTHTRHSIISFSCRASICAQRNIVSEII